MGDKSNCDSPNLWGQIRSAKENLFDKERFAQKYRSAPSSPTTVAFEDTLQNKPDAGNIKDAEVKAKHRPEQEFPVPKIHKQAESETPKATAGDTDASALALPVNGNTPPSIAPQTPQTLLNNHRKSLQATPAPSCSSSRQPSGAPQKPRPCIPLTRAEIISRARKESQSKSLSSTPPVHIPVNLPHTPHTPSPLAQGVSKFPLLASSKPSKATQAFVSPGDTQATAAKMADSDESDEIVFPNRDGRRGDNTAAQRGPGRFRGSRRTRAPCNVEPLQNSVKQHGSHTTNDRRVPRGPAPLNLNLQRDAPNTNDRRVSQVSAAWTEDLHKGVFLPLDGRSPAPTPTSSAQKENRPIDPVEDEVNELARLRNEIVANAHRRANDDPTASPELLTMCRDGPGTDRYSKVYHEMANFGVVPGDDIPDSSYLPGYSQILSTETPEDAEPEQLISDLTSRLKLYQELYKKSPTAYPIHTENEKVFLSPTPTAKHKNALARLRESRRELTPQPTRLFKGKQVVKILETSWDDPVILDWEYCPRCIPDENAYRVRFQGWLEDTINRECAVDIFHQAFFNGTAHADGQTSMFLLDMRSYETILDPNDKASWDYAHETAAGYCYNIVLHNRKADEAEEHRKQLDREIRLEARRLQPLRSPGSPVANIYLRPVDFKDVPELRAIYNWYARNSFDSPNTEDLDNDEVRQRIEESRTTKLPFIVAIDRRSASTNAEKILGYALARDFDRHHLASRFTAELEVYVKEGHTGLGIGRCLLDKLLEVCDPTYSPRSGYLFEAVPEDRSGYYPGGRRRLARLVFSLCYVDRQEISNHKRVKEWLKDYAGFEEQGLLRGVRVKNNYFVNVAYLMRNIGCSKSNTFDP